MASALPNGRAHVLDDALGPAPIIQKRDMLLPGQPNHDPKPVRSGYVKKPSGRNGVDANGIQPRPSHRGEIAFNSVGPGILSSCLIGAEGAVGDSAHPELFVTNEQKLAPDVWAPQRLGRGCLRRFS